MRLGMVSHLVIVSLRDVHADDVAVLLLLEEPFLVLGLEDVSVLVLESLVQAWIIRLVIAVSPHKPILLFLLPVVIVDVVDLLLLLFAVWVVVALLDLGLFFQSV